MPSIGETKSEPTVGDLGWMPVEAAADRLKRSAERICSQAKNGRLRRGVHYRRGESGALELHVEAYLAWLKETSPPKQRKPLIERIDEDLASVRHNTSISDSAAGKHRPETQSVQREPPGRRMPKLIPVAVWAEMVFGDYAPHPNTLRSWVRNGKILPVPVKVGHRYFCSPEARYIDPRAERISRMIKG